MANEKKERLLVKEQVKIKDRVKVPVALVLSMVSIVLSIFVIVSTSAFNQLQSGLVQSAVAGRIYYVDCQSGNDANTGLSTTAAWKTLAKVNKSAFSAGDQILLKRGCTWREQFLPPSSGQSGNPIIIDAYGTGNKPLILASEKNLSWTRVPGTNKWKTAVIPIMNTYQSTNVGFINLTKEVIDPVWGTNVARVVETEDELTAAGRFFWNCTTVGTSDCLAGEIIMYSSDTGGPNAQWPDMEVGLRSRGLQVLGKSYLTIKNLDLRYGTAGSIRIANSHDIILDGIEAAYGGGSKTSATWTAGGSQIRAGDLVKIDTGSYNITVQNSKVSNSWEGCISAEAWAGNETIHDINIINNTLDRCNLAIGVNVPDYSGVVNSRLYNVLIKNNNITNAGYGWAPYSVASHGRGIWFYQSDDSTRNVSQYDIYVENNTIDKFADAGIYIMNGGPYYIYKNIIKNGTAAYIDPNNTTRDSNCAILVHGGGYNESYGDVSGQFIGNLIYNNQARGFGIINNMPNSFLEIYNNTFYNNGNSSFGSVVSLMSTNTKFENNILYSNITVPYLMSTDSLAITSDYNCFYRPAGIILRRSGNSYTSLSAYRTTYSLELHSLIADPLFNDAPTDFTLKSASPVIDKGAAVSAAKASGAIIMQGNATDMGAYEYHPACTPNWSCSVWTQCLLNSQSRTCTDLNNCGSNVNKPAETQACTVACTPGTCTGLGYNCGSWSDGCGNTLACGSCAVDQTCVSGVCQTLTAKTGTVTCGNGVIETGEVCDSTNLNGKTCADVGFKKGTPTCSSDCKTISYATCTYCTSNTACATKYSTTSNKYCSKTTYPGKCCKKSFWLYNCIW